MVRHPGARGGVAERRGSGLQSRTHGFESRLHLDLNARAIGAEVARFLDTEEVTGSIPVSPTTPDRLRPSRMRGGLSCQVPCGRSRGPPAREWSCPRKGRRSWAYRYSEVGVARLFGVLPRERPSLAFGGLEGTTLRPNLLLQRPALGLYLLTQGLGLGPARFGVRQVTCGRGPRGRRRLVHRPWWRPLGCPLWSYRASLAGRVIVALARAVPSCPRLGRQDEDAGENTDQ